MSRKGMQLSTLAVMIIVMIVLVILFVIYSGRTGIFVKSTLSCEGNGGICVPEKSCRDSVLSYDCKGDNLVCCKDLLGG